MASFKDKRILLGVTGGIAAYKTPEIVRLIVKAGGAVKVVLTRAAAEFVTPTTLETVSGNRVYTDLFPREGSFDPIHLSLARWADALLIAPATADIIAKTACGIADDLLTTILLAVDIPVFFCPSMNPKMYYKSVVQENLDKLRQRDYKILEPEIGPLASLTEGSGAGRLPEPSAIVEWLADSIDDSPGKLEGVRVLVTAGPTIEEIDPVRYISNRSSGKMGFALAKEAARQGAEVVLIHGAVNLTLPSGVRSIRILSAAEMMKAVEVEFPACQVALMSAAVADYKPLAKSAQKMKKQPRMILEMVQNPDILKWMGENRKKQYLVGFALEDKKDLQEARRKLKDKNADMIVLNTKEALDADDNAAVLITEDFEEELPLMNKNKLAKEIIAKVAAQLKQ